MHYQFIYVILTIFWEKILPCDLGLQWRLRLILKSLLKTRFPTIRHRKKANPGLNPRFPSHRSKLPRPRVTPTTLGWYYDRLILKPGHGYLPPPQG